MAQDHAVSVLDSEHMRIAIVSDIHGNRTAFEAVLADLKQTAPDLVLHGGDLADNGSSPIEIVDRIRDLGWRGVAGNTDEMLFRPESLEEFARNLPQLGTMFTAIGEMAAVTREALGAERLAWLRGLPRMQSQGEVVLVHGTPQSAWRAPAADGSDGELEQAYGALGQRMVVYGHIHRAYIRSVGGLTVANSGSVSLSYDGDRRAAYLVLDDELSDDKRAEIRRVEYDVEREVQALADFAMPHADWLAGTLRSGRPQAF
jgi:putative phosphoesterase